MTLTQYHELENLLRNFPAQAQARQLKNSNLVELRKTLGQMGVHREMMAILRNKYFPPSKTEETVTVEDEMERLDLSTLVQQKISECLKRAGKSAAKTKINKYHKEMELPVEVQQVVDGQESQTQPAQHLEVQAFLVGEADTCQQFPSTQDYLSGLIDIDKLSDTEICKLFGLEVKCYEILSSP